MDDNDDEEESNTTQPFTPGAASTPYQPSGASAGSYHGGEEHEMSQLPPEQIGQDTDPLLKGDELDQRLQERGQTSPWADLTTMYPNANKNALEVYYQKDKQDNQRLFVKMVGSRKKAYPLFTRNAVTRKLRENPNLSQEIKTYLGKSMLDQMNDYQQQVTEAQQLEDRLNKQVAKQQQAVQEKQAKETQLEQVLRRLENRQKEGGTEMEIQMVIDRLNREKDKLERDITEETSKEKGYAKMLKERDKAAREVARLQRKSDDQRQKVATIEANLNRTKPLDELEAERETLKRKIEEDRQIMNDKNATSQERMTAGVLFSENTDELARLDPQIQEREEALPLRERVKNIFKKYGWTLQAVALAVGVVLSALALAGLNGLKAGTKAVGQGLKAIGQKLGSLLPGLIGSITSFIFKTAGQVFSVLAEHAWLLILAVVAFFMEKLLKKRRKQ